MDYRLKFYFKMPDLLDRIYCSEQIHIPPTFPYIMKLYCKAAIRTQPYDLLKWSAAYFRALANGEEPPVKERIEYPPYDSPSGLTPGYIKILINQFGKDPTTTISAQTLFKKWSDICLEEVLLIKLIALMGAPTTVNWLQFVAVCAGFISNTLTQTMILICELFTEEPEGGMAIIPYDLFIDLYMYLAQMDCGPLTEKEQEELSIIMTREDICGVTGKIKEGIYEGEVEGEGVFLEEMGEREWTIQDEGEENIDTYISSKRETEGGYDMGETEGDGELSIGKYERKGEEPTMDKEDKEDDDMGNYSDKSSFKEGEASYEASQSTAGEAFLIEGYEEGMPGKKEMKPSIGDKRISEGTQQDVDVRSKTMNLEDLEDTIREKIEAKLAGDGENFDEQQEFEGLTSYLIRASTRIQKFTAANFGFKIFKKYMRQDVPGIGPQISSEQIEKVVNFMDIWSHKQEHMVMPRNIRHWMCPPLDSMPLPEP